jgi:hypothetical protein
MLERFPRSLDAGSMCMSVLQNIISLVERGMKGRCPYDAHAHLPRGCGNDRGPRPRCLRLSRIDLFG